MNYWFLWILGCSCSNQSQQQILQPASTRPLFVSHSYKSLGQGTNHSPPFLGFSCKNYFKVNLNVKPSSTWNRRGFSFLSSQLSYKIWKTILLRVLTFPEVSFSLSSSARRKQSRYAGGMGQKEYWGKHLHAQERIRAQCVGAMEALCSVAIDTVPALLGIFRVDLNRRGCNMPLRTHSWVYP